MLPGFALCALWARGRRGCPDCGMKALAILDRSLARMFRVQQKRPNERLRRYGAAFGEILVNFPV